MKKNIFFAVAFAALAFVACNKEENGMVALNIAGEEYQNDEKQAFCNSQLYFTPGDAAYVNGTPTEMTISGARSTHAKLWVPGNQAGYLVTYPASSINYTDGQYTTTFLGNVNLVSADPGTTTTLTEAARQTWPMSGYAAEASAPNFKLYNNVAVLSFAVKYGIQFASAMWKANGQGIDNTVDFVPTESNLPDIYITKIVVRSTNIRLTGSAHLVNADHAFSSSADFFGMGPQYVMDGAPIANGDQVVATLDVPFKPTPSITGSGAILAQTFGHLAMAPCMDFDNGKSLTISYYFNATIDGTNHQYVYTKEMPITSNFYLARGKSFTLLANFLTPAADLNQYIDVL